MITKDQLLAAMQRECDICSHLHSKIPEGGLEFRFTEPQRSTNELLQYLSFAGTGFTAAVINGSWERYTELAEASASLAPEDFPAAMEKQKQDLADLFAQVTEDDMQTREFTQPWGHTQKLGHALQELAYASLVAYRMQLFLQAKAAGRADLGTPNCWAGMDMPAEGEAPS
ncbi:MAG: hypothetical protein QNJ90_07755 [Planctomycetota bacterium]|nr:hypothetical protein [Planctomycetota bacterium]